MKSVTTSTAIKSGLKASTRRPQAHSPAVTTSTAIKSGLKGIDAAAGGARTRNVTTSTAIKSGLKDIGVSNYP